MTLYKNPACACCGEWAEHMRANGFGVSRELCPDLETINYLHKLGEIAAGGGDIRAHVF